MCLLAILLGSFITPGDESIVRIGRNTTTTILMCYMVPLFVDKYSKEDLLWVY